jgi:plasmid maintenance system antidote protein VapI
VMRSFLQLTNFSEKGLAGAVHVQSAHVHTMVHTYTYTYTGTDTDTYTY